MHDHFGKGIVPFAMGKKDHPTFGTIGRLRRPSDLGADQNTGLYGFAGSTYLSLSGMSVSPVPVWGNFYIQKQAFARR